MRILLIEDDLVAARGVILMLKSSGAVVDHADTGEDSNWPATMTTTSWCLT
jgi:two-component system, cell cycle response regulator CtrA